MNNGADEDRRKRLDAGRPFIDHPDGPWVGLKDSGCQGGQVASDREEFACKEQPYLGQISSSDESYNRTPEGSAWVEWFPCPLEGKFIGSRTRLLLFAHCWSHGSIPRLLAYVSFSMASVDCRGSGILHD